jgi:hypothetical protein
MTDLRAQADISQMKYAYGYAYFICLGRDEAECTISLAPSHNPRPEVSIAGTRDG